MNELELKYGCNPNQKPARIFMKDGELPIKVLSGRPGYINFLDAFNGWQLVSNLKMLIMSMLTGHQHLLMKRVKVVPLFLYLVKMFQFHLLNHLQVTC